VYAKALVISHVYGDSDKIRALVREKMEDEYGRVYQIKANCPTRFSIQHLICADVLKCEQALMYAVASSRWVEACKTSTKGKEFEEIVRRPLSSQIGEGCNFWEDLRLAIEVGQPIADAIHQLEADEPLLSQLLPVWSGIASSADKFVTAHPEEKFANLPELVSDRATKHAPVDAMCSAYALDPMHAKKQLDGRYFLGIMSLEPSQREGVEKYLERFVLSTEKEELKAELDFIQFEAPDHLARAVVRLHESAEKVGSARCKTFWTMYASPPVPSIGFLGLPLLSICAQRLLSMHVTSAATERNWSTWGQVYTRRTYRTKIETAEKKVFIRENSKHEVDMDSDEEIELDSL